METLTTNDRCESSNGLNGLEYLFQTYKLQCLSEYASDDTCWRLMARSKQKK